MDELERNSQALKQGAVAVVCITAAATGMNAVSHRGAEQRADAEWTARALAFQKSMGPKGLLAANAFSAARSGGSIGAASAISAGEPSARIELAAYSTRSGYRAIAQAPLSEDAPYGHAMLISAATRDARALAGLRPMEPAVLSEAKRVTAEANCLSQAIYYEARGESYDGQMAVAEVITNRTRSGAFPSTYCGVVYQGSDRTTGCQFTFTCDGSLDRRPRGEAWDRSRTVAAEVMMGLARPITHRATHYHTTEVDPVWSGSLVETTRIGAHVFYRPPTRAEKQAAGAERVAQSDDNSSPAA